MNSSVPDGTVISNQGFVTATATGIVDQPSDDPDTPIANDPTRDVVGNLPLLYAEKRVALSVDLGSPGVVDPGDTLRYTITVQNSARDCRHRRRSDRRRSGEYDLRREFHAAQRVAGRTAGWWRFAARLGRQRRHDLARNHSNSSVRPARQRRHACRHPDQ